MIDKLMIDKLMIDKLNFFNYINQYKQSTLLIVVTFDEFGRMLNMPVILHLEMSNILYLASRILSAAGIFSAFAEPCKNKEDHLHTIASVDLEHFQAKWEPVRRPEMRQLKEIERFRDSTQTESALSFFDSRFGFQR
jgi:hypothetical protein